MRTREDRHRRIATMPVSVSLRVLRSDRVERLPAWRSTATTAAHTHAAHLRLALLQRRDVRVELRQLVLRENRADRCDLRVATLFHLCALLGHQLVRRDSVALFACF